MELDNQAGSGDVPINILLVEDNDADIKITLRAFKKARLENNIYVVEDGQQALDYIFHRNDYEDTARFPRPDLILLDLNLPKVGGFEVLEKLKNEKSTCSIPVVMLTSSKNEEDICKSYSGGAASYIQKPVDYNDFVKVVDGFNFYWHIINKLPVISRE